jgi:hypothetical protein
MTFFPHRYSLVYVILEKVGKFINTLVFFDDEKEKCGEGKGE